MFGSEGREQVMQGMLRNKQDKWRSLSLGCCHRDSFNHGVPTAKDGPNNMSAAQSKNKATCCINRDYICVFEFRIHRYALHLPWTSKGIKLACVKDLYEIKRKIREGKKERKKQVFDKYTECFVLQTECLCLQHWLHDKAAQV